MSKSYRFTAAFMAFILVFFVIFCAAGIDHDCTGEDCLVCALFTGIKSGFGAAVILTHVVSFFFLFSNVLLFFKENTCMVTPMSFKTKLSE